MTCLVRATGHDLHGGNRYLQAFLLRSIGSRTATKHTNHVWADNVACLFAGISKYGSDGTRTRDLRRDRPVMVARGWAGIGGDWPREQGF
jgi:hypothetical protein